MDAATQSFDRLRPRLMGIAYRMLGSVAEAEEVVQDAWLRWHEAATDALQRASIHEHCTATALEDSCA